MVTRMRDHGGLNRREPCVHWFQVPAVSNMVALSRGGPGICTSGCAREKPVNSDALNLLHAGERFSVLHNDLGSTALEAFNVAGLRRCGVASLLETAAARAQSFRPCGRSLPLGNPKATKFTTPGLATCSCVRRQFSANYPSRRQLFIGQFFESLKWNIAASILPLSRALDLIPGNGRSTWTQRPSNLAGPKHDRLR